MEVAEEVCHCRTIHMEGHPDGEEELLAVSLRSNSRICNTNDCRAVWVLGVVNTTANMYNGKSCRILLGLSLGVIEFCDIWWEFIFDII
jgi:hypothetical protein